jgi:hypothetical protein
MSLLTGDRARPDLLRRLFLNYGCSAGGSGGIFDGPLRPLPPNRTRWIRGYPLTRLHHCLATKLARPSRTVKDCLVLKREIRILAPAIGCTFQIYSIGGAGVGVIGSRPVSIEPSK